MMNFEKKVKLHATHIPILHYLVEELNASRSLEIGLGYYSTGYLVEACVSLTSYETKNVDPELNWFNYITEKLGKKKNWEAISIDDIHNLANALFKEKKKFYDLVFVDGSIESRALSANIALNVLKPKFVVVHDIEGEEYDYDEVLNEDYYYYEYRKYAPNTGVYVKNREDFEKIKENIMDYEKDFFSKFMI